MSRNVRTARGTMIDMSALATKHEMTKAVSNVNMNARGDRLNDDGSVKIKAEEIAVAHQNNAEPPQQQPISNPKPIEADTRSSEPVESDNKVDVPDLEEEFAEPEAVSQITRTRKDGTKYVEIEYDDGSIETLEIDDKDD